MTTSLPSPRRRVTAALLACLLLAACTGGADDTLPGGAAALPQGDPPAGTSYAPPLDDRPPAPPFTAELVDGTEIEVADLWAERPVVLVFFASWCTLCAQQQAEVSEVAREYGDRVAFLGVAGDDDPDDVVAYLREHGVPYAVALDDDLSVWLRYAVDEPPLVAFVSKDGVLLRGDPGGLDGDTLRGHIEDLLLDG